MKNALKGQSVIAVETVRSLVAMASIVDENMAQVKNASLPRLITSVTIRNMVLFLEIDGRTGSVLRCLRVPWQRIQLRPSPLWIQANHAIQCEHMGLLNIRSAQRVAHNDHHHGYEGNTADNKRCGQ